ncbi:MAG: hypothetical protein LBI18_12090 [Planctomycetaceae bacterium]|jgi:hypothetical protein|nr:hypothetical protein [Planctomycetaceae bacterium]
MLKKMISLCVVVVLVAFFAVQISAEEAVQATAPVDGVVVAEAVNESPCGCAGSRLAFGKGLFAFRKTLRCCEPVPCVRVQPVEIVEPEEVVPTDLVRISAFKKLRHGFVKTHVWVEKQCCCKKQCECVKPTTCGCPKTCSVQWVSFPAYKKFAPCGFRCVEAWKPVPACCNGELVQPQTQTP